MSEHTSLGLLKVLLVRLVINCPTIHQITYVGDNHLQLLPSCHIKPRSECHPGGVVVTSCWYESSQSASSCRCSSRQENQFRSQCESITKLKERREESGEKRNPFHACSFGLSDTRARWTKVSSCRHGWRLVVMTVALMWIRLLQTNTSYWRDKRSFLLFIQETF